MMSVMLAKRDGTLSLLLLVMACCAAAGYYFLGGWQQGAATAAKHLPTLPDIQVPADTVLTEMDTLRQRLNRLAYPHPAGHAGIPLKLFGYTPAASGLRQSQTGGLGAARPPVQFDYVLSFALSAGSQQLCMLDGQLFSKGAILPDGGQILTIEPERVLIEKAPLKRWIYLQERLPGREATTEARGPGQPTLQESHEVGLMTHETGLKTPKEG